MNINKLHFFFHCGRSIIFSLKSLILVYLENSDKSVDKICKLKKNLLTIC